MRAGKAGSHSNKGWEQFTDKVIEVVDKYGGANLASGSGGESTGLGRGIVFLAWGAWAAKRVARLSKARPGFSLKHYKSITTLSFAPIDQTLDTSECGT